MEQTYRASRHRLLLIGLIGVSIAIGGAPTAAAQRGPARDAPRLAAYLATGFGGDADYNFSNLAGSASLDPTVGIGARVELPLHEYVVVGGSFELLTFEADVLDAEREAVFDFNGQVRIRYGFAVSDGALWLEPYGALPFGASAAVLDDFDGSGDEVWPGWNIGALAGMYLLLRDAPLGFFLEAGWRHHQVYSEVRGPFGADLDLKLVTNQFAMQLGAALVLE